MKKINVIIFNSKLEKLKKTVVYSDSIKIVDYLDGFQTEERGSRIPVGAIATQLSNNEQNHTATLASFDLEILNFQSLTRPFGLKHSVYTGGRLKDFEVDSSNPEEEKVFLTPVTKTDYHYKYNGQEWQDELGLNMYAMDLRQYDPAIGRWVVLDPVIHHSMSPYNAFDNNPVFWADPSGADAVDIGYDRIVDSQDLMGSYHWSGGFQEIENEGGGRSKTGVSENTPKPLVATLTTEMIVTTTDTGDIVSSSSTFSVTNVANKSVYLPPVFIGFSIEIALPDLFNPGKYIGFGLSGGFIADADNNLDFFLTEKTLQNNKTPALQAAAGFEFGILIPQSNNSYVNNNSISGDGYETSGGIGFVGGSYGQDASGTYHQVGINGPGTSLEVGFANWNTSTNTMRLYNGGN